MAMDDGDRLGTAGHHQLLGETSPTERRDQYIEEGYLGPVRVLSAAQCRQFLMAVGGPGHRAPLDWNKGHGATSRAFYEIATHPTIVDIVTTLLGDDVLLWGASIESRRAGEAHPWHTDIESAASAGRSLSVWIGLEQTNRASSLMVVPHSHRFGLTVQEVRQQHGKSRGDVTNADIAWWAHERAMRSCVMKAEMTDGEALFFDGRLWHGSHNESGETRRALLLQYATPDTAIRISDFNYLDWPFRRLNAPRPACVMISGRALGGDNRIVPGPVVGEGTAATPQLTNRVYPLRVPLTPDETAGWKPYHLFRGCTANVNHVTCHASVLIRNHCPHPPHRHDEEEILLLLTGEADLLLPDLSTAGPDRRMRLRAGQLVYYPPHFAHTLQTVSEAPANYLMFKWRNTDVALAEPVLAFRHARLLEGPADEKATDGLSVRGVFDGPTTSLRKLECHASTLAPGAGYAPHVDAHDVAIVVLDGEVETLGERIGPHAVIFHPAGEMHGIRNPGEAVARYVVFEFHGRHTGRLPKRATRAPSLLSKLRDPQRWKRKLTHVWTRLRA